MQKNKIMDFFSALGRSLLMPIVALAACGIFLGLSSALMKAQVQEALPLLTHIHFVIYVINKVSGVVFTLIPVLFAISIAFGMVKEEKEIAAFAGFIGYYTFLVASASLEQELQCLLRRNPHMEFVIYTLDFRCAASLPALFEQYGIGETEVIQIAVSKLGGKNTFTQEPAPWVISGRA